LQQKKALQTYTQETLAIREGNLEALWRKQGLEIQHDNDQQANLMLLGWCSYILIRTPRRARREIRPIQERDRAFLIIIQSRRNTSCASNLLQKLCVSTVCFTKEEEEKENNYFNSRRRRREPLLASSTICFTEE
jgi:hypothetical protein